MDGCPTSEAVWGKEQHTRRQGYQMESFQSVDAGIVARSPGRIKGRRLSISPRLQTIGCPGRRRKEQAQYPEDPGDGTVLEITPGE